jgi:hypothetical protein
LLGGDALAVIAGVAAEDLADDLGDRAARCSPAATSASPSIRIANAAPVGDSSAIFCIAGSMTPLISPVIRAASSA